MRLQCNFSHDLAIESDAALEACNGRQQTVEVSSTPPEAATVKPESYARNQGKVQFV